MLGRDIFSQNGILLLILVFILYGNTTLELGCARAISTLPLRRLLTLFNSRLYLLLNEVYLSS